MLPQHATKRRIDVLRELAAELEERYPVALKDCLVGYGCPGGVWTISILHPRNLDPRNEVGSNFQGHPIEYRCCR
jgi:hypothetical protein